MQFGRVHLKGRISGDFAAGEIQSQAAGDLEGGAVVTTYPPETISLFNVTAKGQGLRHQSTSVFPTDTDTDTDTAA
jgi:hypothetical protein